MSQSPSLQTTFPNRIAAGKALIGLLQDYADRRDAIVLALPRGGVPVAFAVANALQLDLDLMVVRKLGVPGHEEFALGAIAPGGVEVFNEDVVYHHALDQANIGDIVEREQRELARREQVYRGNRPPPTQRQGGHPDGRWAGHGRLHEGGDTCGSPAGAFAHCGCSARCPG